MEQDRNKYYSNDFQKLTLSQIVNSNFRAASVFEKYNLDFCCGGSILVNEACKKKGLDSSMIFNELQLLENSNSQTNKFDGWSLDFMIDYIINNHHAYITKMIPVLAAHTQKVASVHGKNHPEMIEAANSFERIYKDLKQHMMKEEQILFPFIKRLVIAKTNGIKVEKPYFGSIKIP